MKYVNKDTGIELTLDEVKGICAMDWIILQELAEQDNLFTSLDAYTAVVLELNSNKVA